VSVMMTVFVLNLHYRGPKKNEIPFWLQQLLSLSLANIIRSYQRTKKTKNFRKNERDSSKKYKIHDDDRIRTITDGATATQMDMDDNQERKFLHNKNKNHSSSRTRSVNTIHDEIQDTLHGLLRKQKELDHDLRVTNDWRAMATKVDKILFYIFLLLTVISTLGLLVVVPLSRTSTQQKTKLWNGTRRPSL
ncbi:unnamed protein product, partial [Adineta steineri]